MTIRSSDVVQIIADQLAALGEKRAAFVREIEAIDAKVASIAQQLGIEVPQQSDVTLPRLPRPTHPMHAGSMPETMMEILLGADRGYSRVELKQVLRQTKHGDTLKKNENTFYNAVKRYIDGGKIIEVEGLLYHPDRAPLPDGEEDPTGQHLPANVTSLFGLGGADA